MSEYIFENKELAAFIECSGEYQLEIIKAKAEKRCEVYGRGSLSWSADSVNEVISLNAIYRTLEPAPTPNQIDWAQFPAWVVACATDFCGKSYIYGEAIPDFIDNTDWRNANIINIVHISDFPGFKRGTVAPQDSLLIRPIGE